MIFDVDLLTQAEVADLLRCSERTVRRLRLSGELPGIEGRPVLYRRAAVQEYIARREAAPPAERRKKQTWTTFLKPGSKSIPGRGTTKSGGPTVMKADERERELIRAARQIALLRSRSARRG